MIDRYSNKTSSIRQQTNKSTRSKRKIIIENLQITNSCQDRRDRSSQLIRRKYSERSEHVREKQTNQKNEKRDENENKSTTLRAKFNKR